MARRRLTAITLFSAILLVGCAGSGGDRGPTPDVSSPAQVAGSDSGSYAVTKVTDGDTIHVTYQGTDERVRLIGIDTPEVPWYGGKAGCYGVEAGLYARSRLDGRSVGLVFDTSLRDVYGRLLAYVYVGHELFNLTLVQQGYARADPVPPDTRMADAFAKAESDAKAAGRGLWSACPAG